ncbi:hypothetical protein [Streptomyces sp. NPDC048172]|uniref:hypothetical protein n=1 Tax=Streptomyces sp. NPDC048172 TaxID=3365505 RepID=UPI003711F2AC
MTYVTGPGTGSSPDGLTVRRVRAGDPLVRPLLRELAREYAARYGGEALAELSRYPASEFAPPRGTLLLLLDGGVPVAGGAFRGHETAGTAELKRIWTHSAPHPARISLISGISID